MTPNLKLNFDQAINLEYNNKSLSTNRSKSGNDSTCYALVNSTDDEAQQHDPGSFPTGRQQFTKHNDIGKNQNQILEYKGWDTNQRTRQSGTEGEELRH